MKRQDIAELRDAWGTDEKVLEVLRKLIEVASHLSYAVRAPSHNDVELAQLDLLARDVVSLSALDSCDGHWQTVDGVLASQPSPGNPILHWALFRSRVPLPRLGNIALFGDLISLESRSPIQSRWKAYSLEHVGAHGTPLPPENSYIKKRTILHIHLCFFLRAVQVGFYSKILGRTGSRPTIHSVLHTSQAIRAHGEGDRTPYLG